jgi:dTDP-4-dehydrorhamnose reductase
VFGAPTNRPWRETDPTSPLNAYGRMKAEGELNVLGAGGRSCVVRVAWLFGDGNDFIVRLLRNRDGGPVRVAIDQIGSPTPIFTLAKRLLALTEHMVSHAAIPPILHLAGSPPVSRANWAATVFEALAHAGQQPPPIIQVPMAELGSVAARPRYSALDCGVAAQLFGGPLDWREQMTWLNTFRRSV